MRKLIFGRQYAQTKEILFLDGGGYNQTILFSTRNGNATVFIGQQNSTVPYVPSKNVDLTLTSGTVTYSSSGTNTLPSKITFLNGFKDVYSFKVGSRMNISSIKDFFKDFTNIYSINFDYEGFGSVNVVGSLTDIPDSVERLHKSIPHTNVSTYTLTLDVSNFSTTSNLKYFHFVVNLPTTSGNLAKLPSQLYYFKLGGNAGTFTYSGTKVWASSFDTLDIGNATLSVTDTDNLLIDLNNSITTAIGGKVINLANCVRSSLSDSAVAGLQAKGFTVTVANQSFVFDLGLNTTTNGTVTRTTDHKGGNTAIQFGSGNLVSMNNLPASPVWSISFWAKTSQTALALLIELTNNFNNKYAFYSSINEMASGKLIVGSWGSNYKVKTASSVNFNDNQWHHWVLILNRNETGDNEIKIYRDKVQLLLSTVSSLNNEQTGTYVSDKIYLGGRGTSYQYPFVGATSPIKMFNYELSQTEIDNLYNE